MPRKKLILLATLGAVAAVLLMTRLSAPLREMLASGKPQAPAESGAGAPAEGLIKLTPEQIAAGKISVAAAGPGVLTRHITVPALISPDPDRIGRVAAKVVGTVAEMRKKLGDAAQKGEVVAVIDSREVADAKSEYLAASVNYELQSALFQREKGLFEKKITAEQLFLKAKTVFTEARLRLDLARQKLASLDVSEEEIAALPKQAVTDLRRKDIRAPLAGRVIERRANLGQPVAGDTELYVIADLSVVEAELAAPVSDLSRIREKQPVTLTAPDGVEMTGEVRFIGATLTPETRTGRVLASFKNPDFRLRPGSLLDATIALSQSPVAVKIPRAAVQMINNEPTVFVRTDAGFVKRVVKTGAGDDESIEVVSGLNKGEQIAVANTFLLKAELGKGDIPEE